MTVRTLFASVAALLWAARAALAGHPADRDRDINDGWLLLAGVVGVIVLLCWVCARVSDTRNSS
jgi:hypothetical protein